MTARRFPPGPGLTKRQRELYEAVTLATSDPGIQASLINVHAPRVGASTDDIHVVRDLVLAGRIRECGR